MFSLKKIIFGLFGKSDKISDQYKDVSGKGITERYNELLADEADQYTIVAINNFIDNTIVPNKLLEKFIPYAEANIGAPFIIEDFDIRRKLLRFLIRVYGIKSTIPSYEIMFRILGFDVDFYINAPGPLVNYNYYILTDSNGKLEGTGTATVDNGIGIVNMVVGDKILITNGITEVTAFTGGAKLKRQTVLDYFDELFSFDDDNATFDDNIRTFDMNCEGCSGYSIRLYGAFSLDVNLHNAIFRVLEFLEPINANLLSVWYNDTILLADHTISVWIDENGDLNYSNAGVEDVTLTLVEGDLLINGVSFGSYTINENGDLIFTLI